MVNFSINEPSLDIRLRFAELGLQNSLVEVDEEVSGDVGVGLEPEPGPVVDSIHGLVHLVLRPTFQSHVGPHLEEAPEDVIEAGYIHVRVDETHPTELLQVVLVILVAVEV